MEEMQFTAVVLATLLTIKLMTLSRQKISYMSVNTSRWLMVCSLLLLGLQFLLQYTLGLRARHVTLAIVLNLAMFIPCSALLALSVLYLQGKGYVSRMDKYIGIPTWIISMACIAFAMKWDGTLPHADYERLLWAEIVASIVFGAMLFYYVVRQIRQLSSMRQILSNYYDHDTNHLLLWMRGSIVVLALMGLMLPSIIFRNGFWLAVFALFCLSGIFYLVDSFCRYVDGSGHVKMQEAESNEEEVIKEEKKNEQSETPDALHRVELAVAQWTAQGGYLRSGLKAPDVANELQVPRYLFSSWLKEQGLRYNDWLGNLRIEEAKRMIVEHPNWSNEYIAQKCGFADRSQFQKKFKEKTGVSPAEYNTSSVRSGTAD